MDIGTLKFMECRIEEIKDLSRRINAARPKLTFQRLPQHMKRRVMGHTSKRIPRSIMEQHLKQQAKGGMPKRSKPPSRKHRRRPKNAREEFERREKGRRWLETHLWHAKRFHMADKWGIRLAHHPNDRSWRACWRAITGHCLLFDISYQHCIKLTGSEKDLLELLGRLTFKGCKDDVLDPDVIEGRREGRAVLYKKGAYPKGCLGCVSVMWQPRGGEKRQVWLWCHPGAKEETFESINEAARGVEVEEGKFNKFRLVGPLSQPVLRDSLVLFDGKDSPEWLDADLLLKQQELWKKLQNGQAGPGQIFGLTLISRPRQSLGKRQKSLKAPEAMETDHVQTFESTNSQIWSSELQSQLAAGEEKCTPILLVNRPAVDGRHGQGWDIITPKKYGLQLWLRMIRCGARVGALREQQMLNWNTLNPEDLCFYPDTKLGQSEEAEDGKEAFEKFSALPPGKRVGAPWFVNPWNSMLDEWCGSGHFFVQRDKSQLEPIRRFFESPDRPVKMKPEGLVAILVTLEAGGSLERGSIVCLPESREDLLKEQEEEKNRQVLQRQLQTEETLDLSALFSRKIAGFVAAGEYSFNRGCHAGIAFVAAGAINSLVSTLEWNENLQLLVKSKNCPFYRRASVKIL